ncbi:mandelate racemase/muconate lactonizing enzyme family protein [Moorellaceae bacterium AZ2]
MKIVDVRASLIVHPLSGEFRPSWGPGLVHKELALTLVEVVTDEGLSGYGALPCNDKEAIVGVDTFIRPMLVGGDPFNTEAIAQLLRQASLRMGWPWGVEMAIWDLIGKACNQPVYKLWGGYQDKIKVYASFGEIKTPEKCVEDAQRIMAEGIKGVKLRFGSDFRKDLAAVTSLRNAVGEKMAIMVDANKADSLPGSQGFQGWDYRTALYVGRALEELGVLWLEEPLGRFDFEGLARLNAALDMPLAGGEKNQLAHEFKILIERNCYDILQGDCSFSEGLFQLKKIAFLAEVAGKQFIPHTWCNGISLRANLQLAGALPNCPWFEYPYEINSWDHKVNNFLFEDPLVISEDGYIHVPQRPGLGFSLNKEIVARYRRC